jgi:hypothetical protein
VQQLVERYVKIAEELRELMPKRYVESSHDLLGRCWQKAVEATESGYDYLFDLDCLLEFKADAAEERARAATESNPLVDDLDEAESVSAVADTPSPSKVLDAGEMGCR